MALPWEMNRHEFGTFLSCTLCAFVTTFSMLMMTSVLKSFIHTLDVSFLDGIWLAESTVLSTIIFSVITIDISDKIGKKMTVMTGMGIIIVSSVFCAFLDNFYLILISRMISGAGTAMVFAANVSILTDITKKKYLAEVMSFNHVATSLGGACGPVVGFAVAEAFGMTALFLSVVPVCLLSMYLLRHADNVIVDKDKVINIPLHMVLMLSLGCILTGLIATEAKYNYVLATGLVLFVIMVILHRRAKNKVFDVRVFSNRVFLTATILGLLFSIAMYATDNILSYYLQIQDADYGFFGIAVISTVALAAFIKGFKPLIQVVASPTIARMSRGKNPNILSMTGFAVLLVVFALLTLSCVARTSECIIICYTSAGILLAFGNSLFKPMNKSVMMAAVTKEERNAASSVTNIIDSFGKVAGIFVIVNVLSFLGETTEYSFGVCMNVILAIVLVFSVFGIYVCLRRRADAGLMPE